MTGALLPGINRQTAAVLAKAAFAEKDALHSITWTPADAPPIDLRRDRPDWCATFADGTRIYIDADTGIILATRTRFWRAYDLMWGLHIMDLKTRENTSHFVLIAFAAIAAVSILIGLILLPVQRRRAGK